MNASSWLGRCAASLVVLSVSLWVAGCAESEVDGSRGDISSAPAEPDYADADSGDLGEAGSEISGGIDVPADDAPAGDAPADDAPADDAPGEDAPGEDAPAADDAKPADDAPAADADDDKPADEKPSEEAGN